MKEPSEFCNHEAEKAVIGALFLEPRQTLATLTNIGCSPEWFQNTDYRMIYDAILVTLMNGGKVDPILVVEHLPQERRATHGSSLHITIASCCDACTTASHALYYGKIIKEAYERKRIADIMKEGMITLGGKNPPEQIVSEIRHKLSLVPSQKTEVLTTGSMVDGAIKAATEASVRGYAGVPTRLLRLQKAFDGWAKGKMSLVAARPGVGKTTFVSNDASWNALNNRPTAVASMEMTGEEWMRNAICAEAELDARRFKQGIQSHEEMAKFKEMAERFRKAPLYINTRTHTIGSLCSFIRDMATDKGCELIIFDYLQMLCPSGSARSRQEEVASWSNQINNTAKDLPNTAIIGVAQLNRASMLDKNREPELHDLKDSGSLEQDAYLVAFLHPGDADEETGITPMLFKVAKNRSGPTCRCGITFKKSCGRFVE